MTLTSRLTIFLRRLSLSGDWLQSMTFNGTADMAVRKVLVLSRLFTTSWGRIDVLADLLKFKREYTSQRKVMEIVEEFRPSIKVLKDQTRSTVVATDMSFTSPYARRFPSHCPSPIDLSIIRLIRPSSPSKRLCIHLAGTGDHSYWRRDLGLVQPLLKNDISSILVCNPFYSYRKPSYQLRSSLLNVSDLFVMGASLISECAFLCEWAKQEYGFEDIVISGVSMGGFMAGLSATNVTFPIGCAPLLSAVSAAPSYTKGILKDAIVWKELDRDLRDAAYTRGLEEIADCDWIHRTHEMSKTNGLPLSTNLMVILMDEFTSLTEYPIPLLPQATVSVIAECDQYVKQDGLPSLSQVWPGSEVRKIEGGHVTSYFRNHNTFRHAILDAFSRLSSHR